MGRQSEYTAGFVFAFCLLNGFIVLSGSLRKSNGTDEKTTNYQYNVEQIDKTQNSFEKVNNTIYAYEPIKTNASIQVDTISPYTTSGIISITSGITETVGSATFPGTTDSSSTTTGTVIVIGGIGIGKRAYFGTGIYLPTSDVGATASILNYYQANEVISITFGSTAFGTGIPINVVFTRIGNIVAIHIPTFSGTSVAVASIFGSGVPVRYRPGITQTRAICVLDNGTSKIGVVIVSSLGAITISAGASGVTFAASLGSSGPYAFTVVYAIS
jgi:hypothetical protein